VLLGRGSTDPRLRSALDTPYSRDASGFVQEPANMFNH
jgi:hypothetical protein